MPKKFNSINLTNKRNYQNKPYIIYDPYIIHDLLFCLLCLIASIKRGHKQQKGVACARSRGSDDAFDSQSHIL